MNCGWLLSAWHSLSSCNSSSFTVPRLTYHTYTRFSFSVYLSYTRFSFSVYLSYTRFSFSVYLSYTRFSFTFILSSNRVQYFLFSCSWLTFASFQTCPSCYQRMLTHLTWVLCRCCMQLLLPKKSYKAIMWKRLPKSFILTMPSKSPWKLVSTFQILYLLLSYLCYCL